MFGFSLADRITQAATGVAIGVGLAFAAPTTIRKMLASDHKCDEFGEILHTLGAIPGVVSSHLPAGAVVNPQSYGIPFAREILAVQLASQTLSMGYETLRHFFGNYAIKIERRAVGNGT